VSERGSGEATVGDDNRKKKSNEACVRWGHVSVTASARIGFVITLSFAFQTRTMPSGELSAVGSSLYAAQSNSSYLGLKSRAVTVRPPVSLGRKCSLANSMSLPRSRFSPAFGSYLCVCV
jgi:hypothetical protein